MFTRLPILPGIIHDPKLNPAAETSPAIDELHPNITHPGSSSPGSQYKNTRISGS